MLLLCVVVLAFCLCVIVNASVFFVFQAEDGIRDLVRSRGLGDVYKRQVRSDGHRVPGDLHRTGGGAYAGRGQHPAVWSSAPVSYTHLTLPTSDLV